MGTILGFGLYAGCAACGIQAAAGWVRLARTQGGHRDAGSWHAPLIFTSGTFAMLAAAGVTGPFTGAFLSAVPLLAVAAIVARAWRAAAARIGPAKATAIVLGGLFRRVREALWHTREDFRDLAGFLRRQDAPASPAADAAPPSQDEIAALRRAVPALRDDGNLGTAPDPAQVAAGLEAAGVAVPPPWQALAEWVAEFDPEDQDELTEHMGGEAAGLLTFAGAVEARAETLLSGRRLHPAYAAGLLEFADAVAELAALAAMADRRYHAVYGDIEDWHDDGNALPEDARNWFGGGQAA